MGEGTDGYISTKNILVEYIIKKGSPRSLWWENPDAS